MIRWIEVDESWWYPRDSVKDTGVNKLFGYSGLKHHTNSARFGWQPNFNKEGYINIYDYCYVDKVIVYTVVDEWKVGFTYKAHLLKISNKVRFIIDNNLRKTVIFSKLNTWKKLHFYFGGKSKAPHNIFARIFKDSIWFTKISIKWQ